MEVSVLALLGVAALAHGSPGSGFIRPPRGPRVVITATAIATASLELSSRLPSLVQAMPVEPLPKPPMGWAGEVVVLFHGSGGPDKYTRAALRRIHAQGTRQLLRPRLVVAPDWSRYSGNTLTAAYNGQQIGRDVASAIRALGADVTSVHCVGVSVGAFAADTCARAVGSLKGDRPSVRLTLLDPFTARGVLDWGYGTRNFGHGVDFAVQVLNTDDPVPSTNSPLPHCFCYDCTPAKKAWNLPPDYFGHAWPVDLWSKRFVELPAHGPIWRRTSRLPTHDADRPRGGVKVISTRVPTLV